MTASLRRLSVTSLWVAIALAVAAPAKACGVALVVAIDVSSSVDDAEYALQTQGLAAAFRAPEVVEAVLGSGGAMATVVYWSGYAHQDVRVPWTRLDGPASIYAFADTIGGLKRWYLSFPTALGKALEAIETLWTPEAAACGRRIIDVSGDGVNNSGPPPDSIRDRIVASGATVNGLVIKGADPDPEPFYRQSVIGGVGAFVEIADGFEDFPEAIRRKLFRELAPSFAEDGPRLATGPRLDEP